jgi:L-gulono-1,4-lactone dehydrogenase
VRRRWTNWARNVRSSMTAWHAPATEDEIIAIVRAARANRQRVRVVGAGHSWSAIAAPEDIGVTLDRYAGVVAVDAARSVVRVRAGTRLHAFNAALAEYGLALPIVGSIAEQSLAGAIATGTHGSSLAHGNLASLVDGMRIVDGRGEVHELVGERLAGARVHLGALGVVTELSFRVVPAFRLAETVETIPIAAVSTALPAIARSAEYVKVWWMPHTTDAYVYRYERCAEPATTRPDPARQRALENRLHAWVFPALLRLGRLPGVTAPISRAVARTLMKPRCVGSSTLMLSTPMPARHRETEAALPMAAAGAAVERLVQAIDRGRLTVNFIAEVRFVRGDDGWMSPAHGGDTCQLGAYCYGGGSTPYFAAFWREMRALGARPHWGKELDHTVEEIRTLWPRADDFRALRDELDPERVFGSQFHTRILGA